MTRGWYIASAKWILLKMEPVSIDEILRWSGGACLRRGTRTTIHAISTDSRKDCNNALFIPLKGDNFDGHNFINDAVEKGAVACLVERENDLQINFKEVAFIKVEDTLKAFQKIASGYRSKFNIRAVAVTGSNGKTTTKGFVRAVASSQFVTKATEGTKNNHIGVPESVLSIDSSTQVGVFELGMSGFGEIRNLAGIVRPDVGIITNVCHVHTEFFKSLDEVALAKSELLDALPANGVVILNADDAYFDFLKSRARSKVISFGIDKPADIGALDVKQMDDGICFQVSAFGKTCRCTVVALGRHNVYNALAAIAAGIEIGISLDKVCEALSTAPLPVMRFEVEYIAGFTVVNDAYNANPASMIASIDSLDALELEEEGRKILVLGDMLELGWYSSEGHRRVGSRVARSKADSLITVGKLAAEIANTAQKEGFAYPIVMMDTPSDAADYLAEITSNNDIVLLKGSRALKLETIIEILKKKRKRRRRK